MFFSPGWRLSWPQIWLTLLAPFHRWFVVPQIDLESYWLISR